MRLTYSFVVPAALALALTACAETPSPTVPAAVAPTTSAQALVASDASAAIAPPTVVTLSSFIVVDQFGYLPASEKIAVVRSPQKGFDATQKFTPGNVFALVNADTKEQVFQSGIAPWKGGAEDPSSGDKAWWFDFSSIQAPGNYYVLDVEHGARSPRFRIASDVYRQVLRHALRMFFYQRAGFPKEAKYAGEAWADGASHLGPLQDKNCRLFSARDDAKTERDLHGGWYDAGDFNKYTNWHASYLVALLHAYEENPQAFGDDLGIPESGNGLPDVIDEVKWGMDFLVRMQEKDGSEISIVSLASGSPPSSAKGASVYGTPSTSAALSSAAAFAYGAKVFKKVGTKAYKTYADDLLVRAQRAWLWAEKHPNVIFRNNDGKYNSQGVGSGQQETDDYGRQMKKLAAAVHLFDATGDKKYRVFFDANYGQSHMMAQKLVYPFAPEEQEVMLYYTKIPGATPAVSENIKAVYKEGVGSNDNFGAHKNAADPYLAYIKDYTWGSNATKSKQGDLFYDVVTYGIDPDANADAERVALRYVHYLHGTNPLGLVYLSNMGVAGAERSVNEFYHTWFGDGSAKWDRVGVSTYGPPPGYLTGGPNPSYGWDRCCPDNCGTPDNNAKCHTESISPPKDQPPQKSYKDFNTSWPLDSWSVTEPSNGYQVAYIQLLSKFVK